MLCVCVFDATIFRRSFLLFVIVIIIVLSITVFFSLKEYKFDFYGYALFILRFSFFVCVHKDSLSSLTISFYLIIHLFMYTYNYIVCSHSFHIYTYALDEMSFMLEVDMKCMRLYVFSFTRFVSCWVFSLSRIAFISFCWSIEFFAFLSFKRAKTDTR